MSYFYDFHCHTRDSNCSTASIESIVKMAKKRGLDGVAITDHNKLYRGPKNIDGIDIIPGTEVSALKEEHVLAYYVDEDIERGQSFSKTIEDIRNKGGYSVWAHPLRDEDDFSKSGLEVISLFDGLEAGNAMNGKKEQELITKKAKEESLLVFAGSDTHMAGQVGTAVVKVTNRLNKDNFLEEVSSGEIIVRKEITNYRIKNTKWKNFIGVNKKSFSAKKHDFIKAIFLKLILRNYLKFNNISLKKISFNYKEEMI